MSQTVPTPNQKLVTELKVTGHLMLLEPGLFCVFHSPGGPAADPESGLPGVRVSRAPATPAASLTISTFNDDGWIGGAGNAALVRVTGAASHMLVTIYQAVNGAEAPKLQVLRLGDAEQAAPAETKVATVRPTAAPARPAAEPAAPSGKPEVAAHVQRRGDLLTRLGEWMGERGSQSWIEGFAISPSRFVEPTDIEYQAVLGKGWLSPWSEGGQYCGSRGMALPILGLRVRLKGEAAERCAVRVSATFTDGSSVGPVDGSETVEAASLAPLEAFMVEIMPQDEDVAFDAVEPDEAAEPAPVRRAAVKAQPARRVAKAPAKPAPKTAPRAPAAPVAKVVTRGAPAVSSKTKAAGARGTSGARPGAKTRR